jgi:hypothetical protein
MQNRHHAHTTTDVMGIGGQLDDRMGCCFDQQTVDLFLA